MFSSVAVMDISDRTETKKQRVCQFWGNGRARDRRQLSAESSRQQTSSMTIARARYIRIINPWSHKDDGLATAQVQASPSLAEFQSVHRIRHVSYTNSRILNRYECPAFNLYRVSTSIKCLHLFRGEGFHPPLPAIFVRSIPTSTPRA